MFKINKNVIRVDVKDVVYKLMYDNDSNEFSSLIKTGSKNENIIDHQLIMREIGRMMKDIKNNVN